MKIMPVSKLNPLEKLFFAKQLSMFLKAGITLDEGLYSLAEEDEKSPVSIVARSVKEQVDNGQAFHKALAKESRSFDLFFVSMVEVGELSGTLGKSLDFLKKKIEREINLRKKIRAMMYYPMVVIGMAFGVGAFISFFILPKLGDMFRSFDIQLPLATRILLLCADALKQYGVFLLISLIILFFCFRLAVSRSERFRYLWHKFKMRLPAIGRVVASSASAALFRNLGIMLSSGLTLEYALRIESEITENLVMKRIAKLMRENVNKGKKISECLKLLNKNDIPLFASRMIAVGESSGKLEESFLDLADFFEEETENRAKHAASLLEPLLLLFIGMIVGFIALAVILPIYSLTGSIHN